MSAALVTNVDKKLLLATKFPPEFDRKVDMEKVNVPVIKKWVADEVARILNSDDDIVTELISNKLEESQFVRHWPAMFTAPPTHADSCIAQDQGAANPNYRFPGTRRRAVVRQVTVEAVAVGAKWSARCSSRTAGS